MKFFSHGALLVIAALVEIKSIWAESTIESAVFPGRNLRRKRRNANTKARVEVQTEKQVADHIAIIDEDQRQLVDLWKLGTEFNNIIEEADHSTQERNDAKIEIVENDHKELESAFVLEEMDAELEFMQEAMGYRMLTLSSISMSMPSTPSPTRSPPTQPPTRSPTQSPTQPPTASPTLSPTNPPTPSPTLGTDPPTTPTDCLDGTTREAYLLGVFSEITDETLLQDDGTPQGKAYDWFVIDDTELDVCTYPTLLQRYALVVLYYATGGNAWTDKTDWLSAKNECEWFGIECEEGGTIVEEIVLGNNNLDGTLPEEIAVFEGLHSLQLFGNLLSSTIPQGIGQLSNLKVIDFEENMLTGDIFTPEILGLKTLQALRLSFNEFVDEIPPGISSLTDLQELWIAENTNILENGSVQGITGTIPSEIGILKNLTSLLFYSNQLDGAIPSELGLVTDLTFLRLESNFLTGNIPGEIYALTQLRQLRLDTNAFSGTISDSIGDLDVLEDLRLSLNFLTGTIPQTISNLVSLENLLLDSNEMNGNFPNAFADFTTLDFFDISENNFDGPIPDTLFDIPSIRIVYMSNNSFTGEIPANFASPPLLRDLFLNGNKLSGQVPEITEVELSLLSELLLQENDFTGAMPDSICALRDSTRGVLEDLWTDCGGDQPEVQCDFPDCCNRCFPE